MSETATSVQPPMSVCPRFPEPSSTSSFRAPAARRSSFTVTLVSPVPVELTVDVTGADPAETDVTNNARTVTVDVTKNQLATPFRVLFPSLLGYGAQFNNHLYAPITPWPAGADYAAVEDKVKTLEPQLVRIFYNDNWDGNANGKFPDWQTNYASFVKVVELAQASGATIDISVPGPRQRGRARVGRPCDGQVRRRARGPRRDARAHERPLGRGRERAQLGVVTLTQYDALFRALDAQLVARGLRDQIQLMGGGLVENGATPARDHYSVDDLDRREHGRHHRRLRRARLLVLQRLRTPRVPAARHRNIWSTRCFPPSSGSRST